MNSQGVTRPADARLSSSVQPTDAALVQRVLEGDVEAFAGLVDRHHERCLRIATRLLGSVEDAEETVQDAFVRAYRALGRYEEREQFAPWLTRILVNRCRTAIGRRVRYGKTFVEDEHALDTAVTREATDGGMWRAEVERALAALPRDQREAFVLKHVEELEYEAIAEITGAGVSALKMRVKRARERLRALLEGES